MRNLWGNIKIILSFVFCGVAFLLPPIILLMIDFNETINNVFLFVLMIAVCIIVYIIYHDLKTIIKVNIAFAHLNNLYCLEYEIYHFGPFRDESYYIKKQVYKKYLILGKFIRHPYNYINDSEKLKDEIIYKRSKENNTYLYSLIHERILYGRCKCMYSYELLDLCERMMIENSNYERKYIRNCLNLLLIDNKKYLLDDNYVFAFNDLYKYLSFVDYPYYNGDESFNLNRIISYIDEANKEIKKHRNENIIIDELCNLFIELLKCNNDNWQLKQNKYSIYYLKGKFPNKQTSDKNLEILKKFGETVNNKQDEKTLTETEWEHLYKTNFESFWNMAVKEYDLSKLPDRIGNLRDDTMLYGKEARNCLLSRLKGAIKPSNIYADKQWNSLMDLKRKLEENNLNTKVYMLDIISEYERRYIKY